MPPGASEGAQENTRGDQTAKIPLTAWEGSTQEKYNPLCVRILHTQEEAHELIAEKERKQKDDERWRQFSIKEALERDLLSRHKVQT